MREITVKRKLTIGMFILVGIVFLTLGILSVGNLHSTFVKKFKIYTVFSDVSGLQPGNNIWFSGVKIGTVKKLEFQPDNKVKVTMNLDSRAHQYIRQDALVKISTDGLIGNRILVIYGGTAKAGEVQEGSMLGTQPALSTEDMLVVLQENNVNLREITKDLKSITQKIQAGEGTLGKLITDETLYQNMKLTVLALNNASLQAQKLIVSLSDFSHQLNQKGHLAYDLVNDTTVYNSFKISVEKLEQMATDAQLTIENLKVASANPKTPLGTLMYDEQKGREIRDMISNLEKSSENLNENLKALQQNILFRKYFKKKKQ